MARVVEEFFQDYTVVFAFAVLGLFVVGAGMATSRLIRPNKPSREKTIPYECGVDPVGGGWSQSHIRYYIFALLFLIFDVEAVFIFPWAVRLEEFAAVGRGGFVLVEMLIFIGILLVGLAYAIRKGVLTWE